MSNDGMTYVINLYQLFRQGAVGVGMNDPLPDIVRGLVADGYCESFEIRNPHELPNASRHFVRLKSSTVEMLDAQHNAQASDKALGL